MKIKILGCSGGIASGLHTTSFLINDTILIDAGTGLGTLKLSNLLKIQEIFITHAHLDHITSIPFLADSIFGQLPEPIKVHAIDKTTAILMEHIFNNRIWPDFSLIPTPEKPVLEFLSHQHGDVINTCGIKIELLPVKHGVPATGYILSDKNSSMVFSGDTTCNTSMWNRLNMLNGIDCFIIETAFPDRYRNIAEKSFHYCPTLLKTDLNNLKPGIISKLHITHLKPGFEEEIMQECKTLIDDIEITALVQDQIITI